MKITINNESADLEKTEMDSQEFMALMLDRYEEVEDNLFGKILESSDSLNIVSAKDFSAYCDNRGV